MTYEDLLKEADDNGLITKELPLPASKGRILGNRIGIRSSLTTTEKKCVLAEELGHYYTTTGDIMDQSDTRNRKQEHRARALSYNKLVGLFKLIHCYKHGCRSIYEMADYLDVTEDFLRETLLYYQSKYGVYKIVDNYVIYFEPSLVVVELK